MAKYDVKQSMMLRGKDGTVTLIKAGEKQDIPSELLSNWIVVAAIKSGNVTTSGAKKIAAPVKEEEGKKVLKAAKEEAGKIVAAAQEEAEQIKKTAREEAEMFSKLAEEEAGKIVDAAKQTVGGSKKKDKE